MAQEKEAVDFEAIKQKMLKALEAEFNDIPALCPPDDVKMTETMVPMSDGTGLKTYIFRPEGQTSLPVLFMRTCYPHSRDMDFYKARGFAARGFACVIQYCRGTGGSQGLWEPNVNERKDGIDAIRWLADQTWCESIGYFGASYLALTGWAMIDALPEKVKGMYLSVYGTNRHVSAFNDGLFRQDILTAWAMDNAGVPVTADYMESCRYRPQVNVDEALWGIKLPWYEQMICSADYADAYWNEGFWKILREMPSKVDIPVVIEEGWYDHHLGSALSGYRTMSGEGLSKCLLRIGPWNHGKQCALKGHPCSHANSNQVTDIYRFFHTLLKEKEQPEAGVSLYVIGEDRWVNEKCWPKPSRMKAMYFSAPKNRQDVAEGAVLSDTAVPVRELRETGALSEDVCPETAKFTFTYDPQDPVPSYGAESCFKTQEAIGSLKQPDPGYRSDVLTFISEPVSETMTMIGRINVDLYVSSDAEDTAFSVKVMEVFENGEAYNIRSGITTLAYRNHSDVRQTYTPGQIVKVNVDTWDIAWTIRKNSRIRVDISSSDFPQYSIHSNYPGIWAKQEQCKAAHQTIYSGSDYPSAIYFPIQ